MATIVECVPNISEGRNHAIIDAVVSAARAVSGAVVLDVDPGPDTNRTVITIAGEPEPVMEAAFQLVKKAAELIDMRQQHGAHPRAGATDVVPFVPVSGCTMDDCVFYAHKVAQRIGDELQIPVYCYEFAAKRPERKNLAFCRQGEYEALPKKLGHNDPDWIPDFGPDRFDEPQQRSGLTHVSARNFLIAYNINFNTRNHKKVNEIALEIREAGRSAKDDDGNPILNPDGSQKMIPGIFKGIKALGWYLADRQLAQLTMNITDINAAPIHAIFDKVCELAAERGLRVTGSELVGMIPKSAMVDAGKYFLDKAKSPTCPPESELIRVAMQTMGFEEFGKWDPEKKIIDFAVRTPRPLANMTVIDFADELSSDSPAPGGGSIAALAGAMSAGLAAMVPNLTIGKKGYNKKAIRELMNTSGENAQRYKQEFLDAIDDDTFAFNDIMMAMGLPNGSDDEKAKRKEAIKKATIGAIEVPLATLKRAIPTLQCAEIAARDGNQNSLSDSGVAGLMAYACAEGAYYNVLINLKGFDDADYAAKTRAQADILLAQAKELAENIRNIMKKGLDF